jgi:hypothetical protein
MCGAVVLWLLVAAFSWKIFSLILLFSFQSKAAISAIIINDSLDISVGAKIFGLIIFSKCKVFIAGVIICIGKKDVISVAKKC